MTAKTLFAVFPCIGVVQHMVWAHKLVIMGRENDTAFTACLFPPFIDLEDDGRRQLIIKVVQMTDIRFKVLKYEPDLFCGFARVDGP